MSTVPGGGDDVWHVTDIPEEYLTAGMATVIVFEDTAVGTMYHRCKIDSEGYIRVLDREGLPYLRNEGETRPHASIPPRDLLEALEEQEGW